MWVAVSRGMVRIGVRCPVGRAESGSAGRLRRLRGVVAQAAANWARRRGRGIGRGNSRLAGVVMVLAGGCRVRAAGLPRPVVCLWFIAVTHTPQHSTARVKGS